MVRTVAGFFRGGHPPYQAAAGARIFLLTVDLLAAPSMVDAWPIGMKWLLGPFSLIPLMGSEHQAAARSWWA